MQEVGLTYIEGTVDAVIYQDQENSYTVLRLDAGEGRGFAVVGCLPDVAPGESISVQGTWTYHVSYGKQFKAEAVERQMPVSTKVIFDYLASGAVRGIGAATTQRVVEEFGEETLTVLEEYPKRFTQVKDITHKRALAVGEHFRRQMDMRRLLEFLGKHEVPLQLAIPLYHEYGDRALEIIRGNPHLLVDRELGVDFSNADALALFMGMEGDDPQRLEVGLLLELTHNLGNGHIFLPRHKLLPTTTQLIGVREETLEEALKALLERGKAVGEPVAGERAVYLHDLCETEQYMAFRLWELAAGEIMAPHGLEELIDCIQTEQSITYAPQQHQAMELATTSQMMLLTGGPGIGKTTSLRGMLASFGALGLETALAAPAGRAAKRLEELCGAEEAATHRLLGTQYDPHSGRLVFAHDESGPLKADAVVVDETSMVDITLMHGLLSALRLECRLIPVSDPGQLPSVGSGSLFSDLVHSGVTPMVRLAEIFRRAAEGAIVRSAHGINRGELPDLRDNKHGLFFLRCKELARMTETIMKLVKTRLPDNMGIPPEQIQVLSPTRKRTANTTSLNRTIQEAVNPPGPNRPEHHFDEYIFHRGGRVMQVRNDYDMVWKDGLTSGMGVSNGDIGQVVEVDNRTELLTVDFDGRRAEYTPDMLEELGPAYAITVHKVQDNKYRAVTLAACEGAPMLLTRGVLYTAIIRARELPILVRDEGIVAHMTANDRQQRRYSGLHWRPAQLVNG